MKLKKGQESPQLAAEFMQIAVGFDRCAAGWEIAASRFRTLTGLAPKQQMREELIAKAQECDRVAAHVRLDQADAYQRALEYGWVPMEVNTK